MKNSNILIVDDNQELLIALKIILKSHVKNIKCISSPNQLISSLQANNYDLVLLDMNFKAGLNTGNEGIYWLNEIRKLDSDIAVVLITAYGDTQLAVKAIKNGANDFIEKSWDESMIISTLKSVLKLRSSKIQIKDLKQKQKHLTSSLANDFELHNSKAPNMQNLYSIANKISTTDANVLILGENGTGKEVMAKYIHDNSNRRNQIFVKLDLGAISSNLFESELFGHKKGSFTDAKEDRVGRLVIASGGTLFLDEITNIPMNLQVKLLSALQNREVYPIGSTKAVPIDIRLICATNMDVPKMIDENMFREDLLYRINTIQLNMPALRDRHEDIIQFANLFLSEFSAKYQKENIGLSNTAISLLKSNAWKGNIRELRHCIEKAVILSDSNILSESDFDINSNSNNIDFNNLNLSYNEKLIINKAIEKCSGNLSKAAKKLGINRSTLYDKIKKYDL
ncbi:MAG: sigma-54 dependent transcriptional regulator [Marinifilaceae bacterium]|jgi:DNA-binding NtrC family response regulator|nr:sigma-54 dependent transcriptional regulator [Marinifilaceae bacterium]